MYIVQIKCLMEHGAENNRKNGAGIYGNSQNGLELELSIY